MQITELRKGMQASVRATATMEVNKAIAAISGDYNPLHFSDEAAREAGFDGIIAHALFCEGLVSNIIAQKLPGPGSVIVKQTILCRKPVYMGDTVTAAATVREIIPERHRVIIDVICTNQDGREVMSFVIELLIR